MRHDSRRTLILVLIALAATSSWAASLGGAAHLLVPQTLAMSAANLYPPENSGERLPVRANAPRASLPSTIRFREVNGRGLMTRVWVNGVGEFNFAIDTGAGATLLSSRVAREAGVALKSGRLKLGGLSGMNTAAGREAALRSLAVGESDNLLPARGLFIVTDSLPPDVDGVLDPTEAYWPLGYTIDLPRGELSAFDPRATPLSREHVPAGGAVVPWIFDTQSRRPFVMLNGTRRALLDTGSEFGLALSAEEAALLGVVPDNRGRTRGGVRDIMGGEVSARRIAPATVHIGAMSLRGVPTDLLSGAHAGAPILLGRDALQPFRLTFDPLNRLILIAPG